LSTQITPFIQRKGAGGSTASDGVSNQINATRGSGSPLPDNTRSFMESRIGADFSGVRVHTGSEAVQMNRELNAQAFTVGREVYFGEGKYSPDSSSGKSLLAHELTHVVQQAGMNSMVQTCPEGFRRIERATWFNCDEPGAANLACAVCSPDKTRNPNCHDIVRAIGHSNLIAPPGIGRCGDIFEITTPDREDPPVRVTLAERPGGTPLDIHQDVIPQLGLNLQTGRYTVCLRDTGEHDDRVIRAGTSKCSNVNPEHRLT
jgi:hypothetical protein